MYDLTQKDLHIDIRSCAEVMLLGSIERVDAHIPFLGGPVDEWNEFQQSYRSYTNNNFLNCVFELIREKGLTRDCEIFLITRSGRKGAMAASILDVAGYSNVLVDVNGFYSDNEASCNRDNRVIGSWNMGKFVGGRSNIYGGVDVLH